MTDWIAAAPFIFFPFIGSIAGGFITKKYIPIWYDLVAVASVWSQSFQLFGVCRLWQKSLTFWSFFSKSFSFIESFSSLKVHSVQLVSNCDCGDTYLLDMQYDMCGYYTVSFQKHKIANCAAYKG